MKLVNIQAFGINYENYILIENIKDLNLYYKKYRKSQIFNATKELTENKANLGLSDFAYYDFHLKTGIYDNYGSIRNLANICGSVYKNQLKLVLDGKKLGVNFKGGYFPLPNNAIIKRVKIKTHRIFKSKFI